MNHISDKLVTTNKPHKCWGCTKEFPAKSKLRRVTCSDGREISTAYWCASCEKIIRDGDYESSDTFWYGELEEAK